MSHKRRLILLRRYAFRSTEKVALQEIGPRFTLKLRSLKKGLPAVKNLGEPSKTLEFDTFEEGAEDVEMANNDRREDGKGEEEADGQVEVKSKAKKAVPPTEDEYQWIWKVCILFPLQLTPPCLHFL